ncbi:MAG: hypothetical protein WBV94_25180 [Blastocatellia bacterium]
MGIIEDNARKKFKESLKPSNERQEEAKKKAITDAKGKYLTKTLIEFLAPTGYVTYESNESWDAVATITGETMRFTTTTIKDREQRDHLQLTLLGTCPQCREEAQSGAIRTIQTLGSLLEKFEPGPDHQCVYSTDSLATTPLE